MLTKRNIQFSFTLNKENIHQSLMEKTMTRYGYIFDLRCDKFKNFLAEVRKSDSY